MKSAILVLKIMSFFTTAITTLKTLVCAIGAGLAAWGVINLLEGYGNDNPGANVPGAWRSNRKNKNEIDSQQAVMYTRNGY